MKLALDLMVELYYKTLKHAHTGYVNVTLRQLLDHLITTYTAIDQFDLEKNQEKMTARYDSLTRNWGKPLSRLNILWTLPYSVWQKRGCSTTT